MVDAGPVWSSRGRSPIITSPIVYLRVRNTSRAPINVAYSSAGDVAVTNWARVVVRLAIF